MERITIFILLVYFLIGTRRRKIVCKETILYAERSPLKHISQQIVFLLKSRKFTLLQKYIFLCITFSYTIHTVVM